MKKNQLDMSELIDPMEEKLFRRCVDILLPDTPSIFMSQQSKPFHASICPDLTSPVFSFQATVAFALAPPAVEPISINCIFACFRIGQNCATFSESTCENKFCHIGNIDFTRYLHRSGRRNIFKRSHAAFACITQPFNRSKRLGRTPLTCKSFVNDSITEFVRKRISQKTGNTVKCFNMTELGE